MQQPNIQQHSTQSTSMVDTVAPSRVSFYVGQPLNHHILFGNVDATKWNLNFHQNLVGEQPAWQLTLNPLQHPRPQPNERTPKRANPYTTISQPGYIHVCATPYPHALHASNQASSS
jgi:hypothetical protein